MPLSSLISGLKEFQRNLNNYLNSAELLNQITELKREELMKGKRGDGNDITPNYDEVPGFMFWYKDWKTKTFPDYNLNGVPNLYIDGTFHSSLFTRMISPGIFETDSDYSKPFMLDVVEMHKGNGTLLDLTDENINAIADQIENFVLSNFNV